MRSNTEAPPLVLDHPRHEDVVSVRSPEVSENVNACDEHLRFAPPELKVVVPYVDGRSVFQDFNDRMAFKGCLHKGEFWVLKAYCSHCQAATIGHAVERVVGRGEALHICPR